MKDQAQEYITTAMAISMKDNGKKIKDAALENCLWEDKVQKRN